MASAPSNAVLFKNLKFTQLVVPITEQENIDWLKASLADSLNKSITINQYSLSTACVRTQTHSIDKHT